jgi:hypothetical protein
LGIILLNIKVYISIMIGTEDKEAVLNFMMKQYSESDPGRNITIIVTTATDVDLMTKIIDGVTTYIMMEKLKKMGIV